MNAPIFSANVVQPLHCRQDSKFNRVIDLAVVQGTDKGQSTKSGGTCNDAVYSYYWRLSTFGQCILFITNWD